VDPGDALASLLLTAGVPAGQVPPGLEARMALWRDRLAERRLLLTLDDAVSSEQVRPLLPGTGGSLVLRAAVARQRRSSAPLTPQSTLAAPPPASARVSRRHQDAHARPAGEIALIAQTSGTAAASRSHLPSAVTLGHLERPEDTHNPAARRRVLPPSQARITNGTGGPERVILALELVPGGPGRLTSGAPGSASARLAAGRPRWKLPEVNTLVRSRRPGPSRAFIGPVP